MTHLRSARKQVHSLQIAGNDGAITTLLLIHCPLHHRSLHLEECTECPHFARLVVSASGKISAIRCDQALGSPVEPSVESPPPEVVSPVARAPISAAMRRQVTCVRQSMSVVALEALFLDYGISGAPVVDDDGKPVGVVSKTDLLRDRHENPTSNSEWVPRIRDKDLSKLGPGFHLETARQGTVADVMTPVVFSLQENAPISRAAALMAHEGIHRIVVVSSDGVVVGILTPLDVMRWIATHDGYLTEPHASG
ncbi:MAG: CBS domain-containing protein [Deltaproteobacteria bacterium]|nr:CBS domain-containing protein [Deltaproteobacteria bacterium]